jgi:GTP-sensing pleiotropic transcriptional regulator CodY
LLRKKEEFTRSGLFVVEYDARLVGTTLLLPQEAYMYRNTKEKTDLKMA